MNESFTPPGPGQWQLDRSHFTGGTTPLLQTLLSESVQAANRKLWPIMGIPAETISVRFVNGFMYTRLRPLIAPDRPSKKAPPSWILKIVSRAHPEFRRRTKAAVNTLENSPSKAVIQKWHTEIRPRVVQRNLELQDADLSTLDNAALANHVDAAYAHLRWTFEEHFRLHGYDLGPIALLIHAGQGWGIAGSDMVAALAGASPSTSAPLEALSQIRAGLAEAGVTPNNLADVRAASPDIAAQLDLYLRHRGSVLYAGYDIDSPTLGEAPNVILATIVSESADRSLDADQHRANEAALRQRVPEADQAHFDRLLSDAREAMDLRDDNGPITAEWPCGILRLVMLEAGRRLTQSDCLSQSAHVFELSIDELTELLRTGTGPSKDELGERAAERERQRQLDPPQTLGPAEAAPPLDVLPAPLARMIELVQTVLLEMGMVIEPSDEAAKVDGPRLSGTGIGNETIVGRARMAETAEEAIDNLEPGEILVTRTTSPAYNMVLTLVGGLVTSEGGPMCHAAVLSRELNIPAVIGAKDALEVIADGDIISVDPASGSVRVVES